MKALSFILLSLALAFVSACAPQKGPMSTLGESSEMKSDISSVNSDELDPLLEERQDSAVDERVSNWIDSNKIPENAILCTVFFGFDRYSVESKERAELEAIANVAGREGIYIIGYSDYYGTEEYNLGLSDKRAKAVKDYLIKLGSANSAQIRALGEAYATKSGTKAEVAKDRKVIVVDGNVKE